MFRKPAFYLLAFGSMCSIAAVGGANQHLKLFMSLDAGYSQGDAARIISLVLGFSIAGRLLMGWLADHIPKKHVMLIIYVLVAAAIPRALPSKPSLVDVGLDRSAKDAITYRHASDERPAEATKSSHPGVAAGRVAAAGDAAPVLHDRSGPKSGPRAA